MLYNFARRRGLSSIVGALFFVVLMVSAFAVLGVALNSQTDIASTGRDVAAIDLKKSLEDFRLDVTGVGDPAELFISVENVGQNPVEISTVIVAEITKKLENYPVTEYEIPSNLSHIPPGKKQQILPSSTIFLDLADPPLTGVDPELYTIKVISTLGTIKTWTISCDENACGEIAGPPGAGSLSATLFLDGPNGVNTKTSTVVMFVTNTSEETLLNVQPQNGFDGDPECDGFWVVDDTGVTVDNSITEAITNCTVTPSTPQTLQPHEVTIFKWDFTVGGDIGAEFEFCNRAQGEDAFSPPVVQSSHTTTCNNPPEQGTSDGLTVIDPNDCAGCGPGGEGGESIILIDDLLIRPSIFMTIPSPFGDSTDGDNEKGLWGVNVANPTDRDMTISKVTIVAFPPGGNSNDLVFRGIKGGNDQCLETDILPKIGPSPGGYWDCPRDNVVMWQNFTSPVLLEANSTKSFMLKVEPGGIFVENQNLDALIVQANVYSSFGSFGKAGYQSTMYDNDSPIVNVYLTNSTTDLRSGFIGNVNDIANYTNITFDAVIADLDDNVSTFINPGAKFIINVPREWTEVTLLSCEGFENVGTPNVCDGPNEPSVTVHSDGSTQIIGISQGNIGDGNTDNVTDPSEARKISFQVRSAPVEQPQLFVMYILADGIVTTAEGDRTIGPLSEVVLNVDP